jgi:hypothetical protein
MFDVNHLRAVLHLLTGHGQGLLVLAVQDHAGKGFGARHVGALTDVDEQSVRANRDWL